MKGVLGRVWTFRGWPIMADLTHHCDSGDWTDDPCSSCDCTDHCKDAPDLAVRIELEAGS